MAPLTPVPRGSEADPGSLFPAASQSIEPQCQHLRPTTHQGTVSIRPSKYTVRPISNAFPAARRTPRTRLTAGRTFFDTAPLLLLSPTTTRPRLGARANPALPYTSLVLTPRHADPHRLRGTYRTSFFPFAIEPLHLPGCTLRHLESALNLAPLLCSSPSVHPPMNRTGHRFVHYYPLPFASGSVRSPLPWSRRRSHTGVERLTARHGDAVVGDLFRACFRRFSISWPFRALRALLAPKPDLGAQAWSLCCVANALPSCTSPPAGRICRHTRSDANSTGSLRPTGQDRRQSETLHPPGRRWHPRNEVPTPARRL